MFAFIGRSLMWLASFLMHEAGRTIAVKRIDKDASLLKFMKENLPNDYPTKCTHQISN